MKITKKTPLRQRGRNEDKRQATKEAIREVYQNGPQREVQIIPAKRDLVPEAEKKKLRVCAYCRVSTDEETQASSYELQVQNYTKMIQENDQWEFAGIYADEGISGTSVLRRENFLRMIEKCKAGEIFPLLLKLWKITMSVLITNANGIPKAFMQRDPYTTNSLHQISLLPKILKNNL